MRWLPWGLRWGLQVYWALRPWVWPYPACRFTPSCTQYWLQATQRFGAWRGLWLFVKRLLRCHPWPLLGGGGCGHDPVPTAFGQTHSRP